MYIQSDQGIQHILQVTNIWWSELFSSFSLYTWGTINISTFTKSHIILEWKFYISQKKKGQCQVLTQDNLQNIKTEKITPLWAWFCFKMFLIGENNDKSWIRIPFLLVWPDIFLFWHSNITYIQYSSWFQSQRKW